MPTVQVPHVLHKDKFVNQRTATTQNVQKAEDAPHDQFFDRVEESQALIQAQLCRRNRFSNQTHAPTMRKCRRRCVEHPDWKNREGSSVASHR